MNSNPISHLQNTNTLIFLAALKKLKVKHQILEPEYGRVLLKFNGQTHQVTKKSFALNAHQAITNAKSKQKTRQLLQKARLPVPNQITVSSISNYQKKCLKIPLPQVIKPLKGQKGRHIYLNIKNKNQALSALKLLFKEFPDGAVIEPYFKAQDYRFFVLNNKVIGASKRLPPTISGDGQHTIRQLIDQENQRRHQLTLKTGRRMLNRLHVWPRIKWYLNQQGYTFNTILPKNKKLTLYPIPNFSTGGSSHTIPIKNFHPTLIQTAQKAVQAIGLTIAGVDMLIKNTTNPCPPPRWKPDYTSENHARSMNAKPHTKPNYLIIEVNSDPSLRLHDWPNTGHSQHVAEKVIHYIKQTKLVRQSTN